ncbi:MAG: hypothetical protein MRERC_7c014 [Mycoplasmataceae bacterium RC_NB112A]|nr:MAG: hypothetical protein MRERC_10c040 [Mycoplasmataceae bacterium RC_NB112A]KLL01863.1 MAG: hypothetical protein MRERC_7c014 [Mycoplasmataceae bacterium RC_NB112A]
MVKLKKAKSTYIGFGKKEAKGTKIKKIRLGVAIYWQLK